MTTGTGWSDSHPDDLQLVAFADTELDGSQREHVEAHVAACLRCRRRLAGLLPPFSVGEAPLPEHSARVAPVVLDALAKPLGGEPQPGELWRVVGPDEAMLVWAFRMFDDAVRVIPCSFDVELADEYTVVLSASESPLGLPLALHTTIETELPSEVFDARVATLDLVDDVGQVRAARQRSRPAPPDIRVGPPIVDPLDERVAFREALAAVAGKIAAAVTEDLAEEAEDLPSFLQEEPRGDPAVAMRLVSDLVGELVFRRPHAQTDTQGWPALPTSLGPLRPVLVVQEFAVRIVACMLPVADAALLDEEAVVQAAGELLRARNDVALVALVAADAERTTRVRDLYDTAGEVMTAPEGTWRKPIASRPALPFIDAIAAVLEEMLPNFEALDEGLLRPAEIEFAAIATRAAEDAVRNVLAAGASARRDAKKEGYGSVGLADQVHIAQTVELLRAGELGKLQERIDELVRLAS